MPADLDHPTLGRLTYDRQLEWYSTSVSVQGRDADLHVFPGGPDGSGPGMKAAAGLVLSLGGVVRDAKQYAATSLLAVKNGTWLDSNEPGVTVEGFMERMVIESVVVNEDGSATIYFKDGDLFWGHLILVERDRNGAFGEAHIAG